jgi:hypothetical protein
MNQTLHDNGLSGNLMPAVGTGNAYPPSRGIQAACREVGRGAEMAGISRTRSCERFMMTEVLEGRLDTDDEDTPSVIELVDLYPIAGIISLASYLLLS